MQDGENVTERADGAGARARLATFVGGHRRAVHAALDAVAVITALCFATALRSDF